MKRGGHLLFAIALLPGCAGSPGGRASSPPDPSLPVVRPVRADELVGALFHMGGRNHMDAEGRLVFECDCCFDHLRFLADGTFQLLSPCVENSALMNGTFTITGDTLIMHPSPRCIRRSYNMQHEVDASEPAFTFDDTVIASNTWVFRVERGVHGVELHRTDMDEVAMPDPRGAEIADLVDAEITELLQRGGSGPATSQAPAGAR